jgi:D-inositol-3-phosphate glycosyltransferase
MTAAAVAGPAGSVGRRLLFLDPIGHTLGGHDHGLCTELTRLGFDVTLGTNDVDPHHPAAPLYRRIVAYHGIVGDGWRGTKMIRYLRSQRRLLREMRKGRWDAVVQYYALEPHLDGHFLRAQRRMGLTSVLCVHDVVPLHRDGDFLGAWRRAYASASRLVAFSSFARDRLVEDLHLAEAGIAVGDLGVDRPAGDQAPGRAAARARLGIPAHERMLLCFGSIKKTKSLDLLVSAFARTAEALPDARLWIVGRPQHVDLAPLVREIRQRGLERRIELRPESVDPMLVPLWFEAADVMVLPYSKLYQSDVLLRACAHQRPVVATAVGANPELIRSGQTGWLVPPGDVAALAEALSEALSGSEEAMRRGRAACAEVLQRCSWSALARTLASAVDTARAADSK